MTKQERIKTYGEVFTPPETVQEMCDMLEQASPDAFKPCTTFLEPTCGDGAFVVEILRRKFENCKSRKDYTAALESVWGLEIQAQNVEAAIRNVTALCERYFMPTKAERKIINDHYIQCDSLKTLQFINQVQPGMQFNCAGIRVL